MIYEQENKKKMLTIIKLKKWTAGKVMYLIVSLDFNTLSNLSNSSNYRLDILGPYF